MVFAAFQLKNVRNWFLPLSGKFQWLTPIGQFSDLLNLKIYYFKGSLWKVSEITIFE